MNVTEANDTIRVLRTLRRFAAPDDDLRPAAWRLAQRAGKALQVSPETILPAPWRKP